MKSISEEASIIFSRVRWLMAGEPFIELSSPGRYPVGILKIKENIPTPFGMGITYSICQYIKDGEPPTRLIESSFLLVGNAKGRGSTQLYPYYYFNRKTGLKQYSVMIKNNVYYIKKKRQLHHAQFADRWIRSLREQKILP